VTVESHAGGTEGAAAESGGVDGLPFAPPPPPLSVFAQQSSTQLVPALSALAAAQSALSPVGGGSATAGEPRLHHTYFVVRVEGGVHLAILFHSQAPRKQADRLTTEFVRALCSALRHTELFGRLRPY
jgi:hypothetical protein